MIWRNSRTGIMFLTPNCNTKTNAIECILLGLTCIICGECTGNLNIEQGGLVYNSVCTYYMGASISEYKNIYVDVCWNLSEFYIYMRIMDIINCIAISVKHGYMFAVGTLFCFLFLDVKRPLYKFSDGPEGNMETLNWIVV